eukprot:XP_765138.1 hypothetical protein [Theileria parva strain Muguga]
MSIQMIEEWETPIVTFVSYYKSNKLTLENVLLLLQLFPEESNNNRLLLTNDIQSRLNNAIKTQYHTVLLFLNEVYQLVEKGKLIVVWYNWYTNCEIDTITEFELLLLQHCIEIIQNPSLNTPELYELAIDSLIHFLHTNTHTHTNTQKNKFDTIKKTLKNVLYNLEPQLVTGFENADTFLFDNISLLLVNVVEPGDELVDWLVKFIEVPYLLLYKEFPGFNPFKSDYSREHCRQIVLENKSSTTHFDDQLYHISKRATHSLIDLSNYELNIVDKMVSSILLLTVPPYNSTGDINLLVEFYEEYVDLVLELYDVIYRVIGFTKAYQLVNNLLSTPNYGKNLLLIMSSLYLLPSVSMDRTVCNDVVNLLLKILENNSDSELFQLFRINSISFFAKIRRSITRDSLLPIIQMINHMLTQCVGRFGERLVLESVGSIYKLCQTQTLNLELFNLLQSTMSISSISSNLNNTVMILEAISSTTKNATSDMIVHVYNTLFKGSLNTSLDPSDTTQLLSGLVGFLRNLGDRADLRVITDHTPVLLRLLHKYHLDEEMVELICRCLKHTARVSSHSFLLHVGDLVNLINAIANVKLFSTYLYVVQWLFLLIGTSDTVGCGDTLGTVVQFYGVLTVLTLKRFSEGVVDQLLVEDFYGLQAEFFLETDQFLTDLNTVQQIIKFSTQFLFLRCKNVFQFWFSLLRVSRNNLRLRPLVLQHVQQAVNNCFALLTNNPSHTILHHIQQLFKYITHMNIGDIVDNEDNMRSAGPSTVTELMNTGLNELPGEIISNEKMRRYLLEGLVNDTKDTTNHLHKLLSKLAMRYRQ